MMSFASNAGDFGDLGRLSSFTVHGNIYHSIGNIDMEENEKRFSIQLYFIPEEEAVDERMKNQFNEGCERTIVEDLT